MGSPDPATADPQDPVVAIAELVIAEAQAPADNGVTTTDRLIAAAIHCLACAMTAKLGQDPREPDIEVARRASHIVNATCNRAGNRFAVLVDGSQADAAALAYAMLAAGGYPTNREPSTGQLLQAGEAISLLCASERIEN
jgi:hypothetical protein